MLDDNDMVFVRQGGLLYHRERCFVVRSLMNPAPYFQITTAEARKRNLAPCSTCYRHHHDLYVGEHRYIGVREEKVDA